MYLAGQLWSTSDRIPCRRIRTTQGHGAPGPGFDHQSCGGPDKMLLATEFQRLEKRPNSGGKSPRQVRCIDDPELFSGHLQNMPPGTLRTGCHVRTKLQCQNPSLVGLETDRKREPPPGDLSPNLGIHLDDNRTRRLVDQLETKRRSAGGSVKRQRAGINWT